MCRAKEGVCVTARAMKTAATAQFGARWLLLATSDGGLFFLREVPEIVVVDHPSTIDIKV